MSEIWPAIQLKFKRDLFLDPGFNLNVSTQEQQHMRQPFRPGLSFSESREGSCTMWSSLYFSAALTHLLSKVTCPNNNKQIQRAERRGEAEL